MSKQFFLKNDVLTATFCSFGAELTSLVKNETKTELLWQNETKIWARHAPVLFPIVGKLVGGEYSYENQTYKLPQHGFARDMDFETVEQNENSVTFCLRSCEKTKQVYPFNFVLKIKYILEKNTVSTLYQVSTPDEFAYFSIGAHPGFNLDEKDFEKYSLCFDKNAPVELTSLTIDKQTGLLKDGTYTAKNIDGTLHLSDELLFNDTLIFQPKTASEITLFKNQKPLLGLNFSGFEFFAIWQKQHQFLCLEPWCGVADFETSSGDFIKKRGIVKINNDSSLCCEYKIIIY